MERRTADGAVDVFVGLPLSHYSLVVFFDRSVDRRIFQVHLARKTMTANEVQTQLIDRRFPQVHLARIPMLANDL